MDDGRRKMWANKIVGHGEESPEQLLAHPDNFKIHWDAQMDALEGSIEDIGYIRSVTVSTKGHVVDGHARIILALRNGEKSIPVEYVDLTEEEERKALLVMDPIAAMAGYDNEKLQATIASVHTDNENLASFLEVLSKAHVIDGEQPLFRDDFGNEDTTITCPKCGHCWDPNNKSRKHPRRK